MLCCSRQNLVEKSEELGPTKEKVQIDVRHVTSSISGTIVVENVQVVYVEHGETSMEDFLFNQVGLSCVSNLKTLIFLNWRNSFR